MRDRTSASEKSRGQVTRDQNSHLNNFWFGRRRCWKGSRAQDHLYQRSGHLSMADTTASKDPVPAEPYFPSAACWEVPET